MHMTADGCAYLVAEVCIEHLEHWDNPGVKKMDSRFKIPKNSKVVPIL